jgi:hypothetical protein
LLVLGVKLADSCQKPLVFSRRRGFGGFLKVVFIASHSQGQALPLRIPTNNICIHQYPLRIPPGESRIQATL